MGIFDSIFDTIGDAVDFVAENPIKSIAAVVVTVGTGGLALAYAPAIAAAVGTTGILGATATTGTVISTLEGVALANASLAALGGGAVAVGGGGIAAGTTAVAVAVAGTVTGAVVSVGTVAATS